MNTTKMKWYDNRGLLIVLFFLAPPLGLYAMIKHETALWKKVVYLIPASLNTLFIIMAIYLFELRDNYTSALDSYNKKDYETAYNDLLLVKVGDDNYNNALLKIKEIKPIVDSIKEIRYKENEEVKGNNPVVSSKTNDIEKTGKFRNFSVLSYVTVLIIFCCLLYSFFKNLSKKRSYNPYVTLVIANIAFMIFTSTVPDDFDIYTKGFFFMSVVTICWFLWIKLEEDEENKNREFLQNGKDSMNEIYVSAKSNVSNGVERGKEKIAVKVKKSLGDELLSELAMITTGVLTNKVDGFVNENLSKTDEVVSSFFEFLGESNEQIDSRRKYINMLRLLILSSMLVVIYFVL